MIVFSIVFSLGFLATRAEPALVLSLLALLLQKYKYWYSVCWLHWYRSTNTDT
jgi:hypothetical protein